jgi:hypothetical protein
MSRKEHISGTAVVDQAMRSASLWGCLLRNIGALARRAIMGVIAWIVLGAVAGSVAEHLIGKGPASCWPPSSELSVRCLAGSSPRRCSAFKTLDTFFNLSTWVNLDRRCRGALPAVRAIRGCGRRSRERRSRHVRLSGEPLRAELERRNRQGRLDRPSAVADPA